MGEAQPERVVSSRRLTGPPLPIDQSSCRNLAAGCGASRGLASRPFVAADSRLGSWARGEMFRHVPRSGDARLGWRGGTTGHAHRPSRVGSSLRRGCTPPRFAPAPPGRSTSGRDAPDVLVMRPPAPAPGSRVTRHQRTEHGVRVTLASCLLPLAALNGQIGSVPLRERWACGLDLVIRTLALPVVGCGCLADRAPFARRG